jgi:hypothetical protein
MKITQAERIEVNRRCWEQEMTPVCMDQFPAWELVPIYSFIEPVNWAERWEEAGGPRFHPTRLIALKSDPVWAVLGSKECFGDALGNPFPPFAEGSAWGWRQVPREECTALKITLPIDPSFLQSVPKAAVPLSQMKADRDSLLAAAAALRRQASEREAQREAKPEKQQEML